MPQVIFFDEEKVIKDKDDIFELDFLSITDIEELFKIIGEKLSFELIPRSNWDAFIDQFGEFCLLCERDTVLILRSFKELVQKQFELAIELLEVMCLVINRHYFILEKRPTLPKGKWFHENHNVTISLVLK